MAYGIISPELREELNNSIIYGLKALGFGDEDVKEIYSLMTTGKSRKSMYQKLLEKSVRDQKPFRIVGFSDLMKSGTIKDISNNIEYTKNDIKSYDSEDYNRLYKDIVKIESDILDKNKHLRNVEESIKDLENQIDSIDKSLQNVTIDAGNIPESLNTARDYSGKELNQYLDPNGEKSISDLRFESPEELSSAENTINSHKNPLSPLNQNGKVIQETLSKVSDLESKALNLTESMQKIADETRNIENELLNKRREIESIKDKDSIRFNMLIESYNDKLSKYNEYLSKLNKINEAYNNAIGKISEVLGENRLKEIIDYSNISEAITASSEFMTQYDKTLKDFPISSLPGKLGILESFYKYQGSDNKLVKIRKVLRIVDQYTSERVSHLNHPGLKSVSSVDFNDDILRKYYFGIINGKIPVGFKVSEEDRLKLEEFITLKRELENDFNKLAERFISDDNLISVMDYIFDEDGNMKETDERSGKKYYSQRVAYLMLKPIWSEIHNEGGVFYGKSREEIERILKDDTFRELYKTYVLGIGSEVKNKDIEDFRNRYGISEYEGGSGLDVFLKSLGSSLSFSLYVPDLEKHFPTTLSMALYGQDVVERVAGKLSVSSGVGMILGTATSFLIGYGALRLLRAEKAVKGLADLIGLSKRVQSIAKTVMSFAALHAINSYTEALMESRFQEEDVRKRIDSNKEIYGILKDILKNNNVAYDLNHRKKVEEALSLAYYNADLYAEKAKDYIFRSQFKFLLTANIFQDAIEYYLLRGVLNRVRFISKAAPKPFTIETITAGSVKYPVLKPASFYRFVRYNLRDTFLKPSFMSSVIAFGALESAQEVAQDYINASIYYSHLRNMNDDFMVSALSRDRRWYATLNSSEVDWSKTMIDSAISGVIASSVFGILGAAAGTMGYRSYKRKIHTFNHVLSSYHDKLSGFVKYHVNPDNTLSISVDSSLMKKMTDILLPDSPDIQEEDVSTLKEFVFETAYLLQIANELGITNQLSDYADTIVKALKDVKSYLNSTDKNGNIGVSHAVRIFKTLRLLNIKPEGVKDNPTETEIYEFFNNNRKEIIAYIDEMIPTIGLFVNSMKDLSSSLKGNNAIGRILTAMKRKGGYDSVLEQVREHFGFKSVDDLLKNVNSLDKKKIEEFQKKLESREKIMFDIFEEIISDLSERYDGLYYSVGSKGNVQTLYVYNHKDAKYYKVVVNENGVSVEDKPSDVSKLKVKELKEDAYKNIGVPFLASYFSLLPFASKIKIINRFLETHGWFKAELEEYKKHLNTLSVISYMHALRPYLETIYFTDHVLEKIVPHLNAMGYDRIFMDIDNSRIRIREGNDEIVLSPRDVVTGTKHYTQSMILYLRRSLKLVNALKEEADKVQNSAQVKEYAEKLLKDVEDFMADLEKQMSGQQDAANLGDSVVRYDTIIKTIHVLLDQIKPSRKKAGESRNQERKETAKRIKELKKEARKLLRLTEAMIKIHVSEVVLLNIRESISNNERFVKLVSILFEYLMNYSPEAEMELSSVLTEVLGVVEGKEKEYIEVIDYISKKASKFRDRLAKGRLDSISLKLRGSEAAKMAEALRVLSSIMRFISERYAHIPSIQNMVDLDEVRESIKRMKGVDVGRTDKGRLFIKTPWRKRIVLSDLYIYGILFDYSLLYNTVSFLRNVFGSENIEVQHPDNPSDAYRRHVEGFGIIDGLLKFLALESMSGKRHYDGKAFRAVREHADKHNVFAVNFDAISVFDSEESAVYMDRFRRIHEFTYLELLEKNRNPLSLLESVSLRLRLVEPDVLFRRKAIRNIKRKLKSIKSNRKKIGAANLTTFMKDLRVRVKNEKLVDMLSEDVNSEEIEGSLSSLSYAQLKTIDEHLGRLDRYGAYYEMASKDIEFDKNKVTFLEFINHAEQYMNVLFMKFINNPEVLKKYKIRNIGDSDYLISATLRFIGSFEDRERAHFNFAAFLGFLKSNFGLFAALNLPFNISILFKYLGLRIIIVDREEDRVKYLQYNNVVVLTRDELNSAVSEIIKSESDNILNVIKNGGIPQYYIAYKVFEQLIRNKGVVPVRGLLPSPVKEHSPEPVVNITPETAEAQTYKAEDEGDKKDDAKPVLMLPAPGNVRKSTLLDFITENVRHFKNVSRINNFRLLTLVLKYIDAEDIKMQDSVSMIHDFIHLISSFGIDERKFEKIVSHELMGTIVSVLADFPDKLKGLYHTLSYKNVDVHAVLTEIQRLYRESSGIISTYEVSINAFINLLANMLYDRMFEPGTAVTSLYYMRTNIVNTIRSGWNIDVSEMEKYKTESEKVFRSLLELMTQNTDTFDRFFKDLSDVIEGVRDVRDMIKALRSAAKRSGLDSYNVDAINKVLSVYSTFIAPIYGINSNVMKMFIKSVMSSRPDEIKDADSFIKPFVDQFVDELTEVKDISDILNEEHLDADDTEEKEGGGVDVVPKPGKEVKKEFMHVNSKPGTAVVLQKRNTSVLNMNNVVHVDYGNAGIAAGGMEVRRSSRTSKGSSFFTDPVQNHVFFVWNSQEGNTDKVKLSGYATEGRRVINLYYGDRHKASEHKHSGEIRNIYVYRRSASYSSEGQTASLPEGNYRLVETKYLKTTRSTDSMLSSLESLVDRYIEAITKHIEWVKTNKDKYSELTGSLFGFIEKEAFSFRDFSKMTINKYIGILERRINTLNELKDVIPDKGFVYAESVIIVNKDLIENENIEIEVRKNSKVVKRYSMRIEKGKEGSLKDAENVEELIRRIMEGYSYKVYNAPPVKIAVTADEIAEGTTISSPTEIKNARILYEVPVIRFSNDRTLGDGRKRILRFTDAELKENAEIAAALKVFDNILTAALMEVGSFRFFVKGESGTMVDEEYASELENILSDLENANSFIYTDSLLFKADITDDIESFVKSSYIVNPEASDIKEAMSASFDKWSESWPMVSYVDGISGSYMRFRERKVSYKLYDSNVHINDVHHQAMNSTRRWIIRSYKDNDGNVIYENVSSYSRAGVVIEGYGSEEPVDVVLNIDDSNVELLDTQTFFHLSHLTSSDKGDGAIIIKNKSKHRFAVFNIEEALNSGDVSKHIKSFIKVIKGREDVKVIIVIPAHILESKKYSFSNKSYTYNSVIIKAKDRTGAPESYKISRRNPTLALRAEDLRVVLGDLQELFISFINGKGNSDYIDDIADGITAILKGAYPESKREKAKKEKEAVKEEKTEKAKTGKIKVEEPEVKTKREKTVPDNKVEVLTERLSEVVNDLVPDIIYEFLNDFRSNSESGPLLKVGFQFDMSTIKGITHKLVMDAKTHKIRIMDRRKKEVRGLDINHRVMLGEIAEFLLNAVRTAGSVKEEEIESYTVGLFKNIISNYIKRQYVTIYPTYVKQNYRNKESFYEGCLKHILEYNKQNSDEVVISVLLAGLYMDAVDMLLKHIDVDISRKSGSEQRKFTTFVATEAPKLTAMKYYTNKIGEDFTVVNLRYIYDSMKSIPESELTYNINKNYWHYCKNV